MPYLGDTTGGSGQFPGNENRALVTLFTATSSGTLTGNAQAFFAATSTAVLSTKVIVYSNSSGVPGTLIGVSGSVTVPAGGGMMNYTGLPAAAIVNGTSYFLGVVSGDFQANHGCDDVGSGMTTLLANGSLSYASPPASWPGTDGTYANLRMDVAVEYDTVVSPPVVEPGVQHAAWGW